MNTMECPCWDASSFGFRLSQLRTAKNISARDMSLQLGLNKNYINSIECGKCFPSMYIFFSICSFLEITPKDFFENSYINPNNDTPFSSLFHKLSPSQANCIYNIAKDLIKK